MNSDSTHDQDQRSAHMDTLTQVINSLDLDEGCVIDIEEARDLPQGGSPFPINAEVGVGDALQTSAGLPEGQTKYFISKDSGLCSRMSEADGEVSEKAARALLLGGTQEVVLTRRLARISECQHEEPCTCSFQSGLKVAAKVLGVFGLLYLFICNLDLLGNAFKLLGGKTAGSVFNDSELLLNPITGLMIGVMATVLLQSSSTSSSIVITMVASNILPIQPAIFIIMGANIGTTVTNTLVSLAHSMDRKEFRRAFSGAVVHDVFNWLTVLILLPLEYCTGYLFHLTKVIVESMNFDSMKAKKQDLLKKLTKPLTSKVVQVDKKVITGIAEKKEGYADKALLKEFCVYEKEEQFVMVNTSMKDNTTGETSWAMVNTSMMVKVPKEKCPGLLNQLEWDDKTAGALLFVVSILLLSACLYLMVKLLHSLLGGHIAKAARKTINADFPSPFHWLTGYAAILVGAGLTILVQSSSVFTSALTPLVGVGCLKLERMFPLTLGSNIGTTFTGILAALAAPPETMGIAIQLAFCHLFFNVSGILIFYPVPKMRRIVLQTAKYLGRTTAIYRWFAVAYLIFMFILFPVFFFTLSLAGPIVFIITLSVLGLLAATIVAINVMQRYQTLRQYLPESMHTWHFLPECLRSLRPLDRLFRKICSPFTKCCCQCCLVKCSCLMEQQDVDHGYIDDSDSEDETPQTTHLNSVASSKMLLNKPDVKFSDRIYKPKDRSNAGNRSPSLKQRETKESQQSQLTLTASPIYLAVPSKDPETSQSSSNDSVCSSSGCSSKSDTDTSVNSNTPLIHESNESAPMDSDLSSIDIEKLKETNI